MKNARGDGTTIVFTAGEALQSGDCVTIGNLVGVVVDDAANAATDVVARAVGVFEIPKDGSTFAQGDPVYVIPVGTGQQVTNATSTALGNQFAGYAWKAAAGGATVVEVKINPGGKSAVG